MDLPKILVDQVRSGGAVLFLGAGAAKGALHPTGSSIPNGCELARAIATKFLGSAHTDRPLAQVVELAISEADLITVQTFIRSHFIDFQPSEFHKLIPRFVWAAIA